MKLLIVARTCRWSFYFNIETFEMQFFYMAYFFIEAEELDKLNWSKKFFYVFSNVKLFEWEKVCNRQILKKKTTKFFFLKKKIEPAIHYINSNRWSKNFNFKWNTQHDVSLICFMTNLFSFQIKTYFSFKIVDYMYSICMLKLVFIYYYMGRHKFRANYS